MKKDLDYYLSLNYPIEIKKIPDEEGGGYVATIPQLGRYAFVGDGDTVEEALANLQKVKKYLFEKYLNEGIPIPEPTDEEASSYSGKFVLRIPVELHHYLATKAKENHTTLNQYCLYLLTRKSYLQSIHEEMDEIKTGIRNVFQRLQEMYYRIQQPRPRSRFSYDEWESDDYKKSA